MMADAYHFFGEDLQIGANGDIRAASGDDETKQRILRRLLTPEGAFIWSLGYGAGMPALIGQPVSPLAIQNAVRAQIFKEAGVAKFPEPTINVTRTPNGTFTCSIAYTAAVSGQPQILTVP